MSEDDGYSRGLDRVVILLLLALFFLLDPVRSWWASGNLPWYIPYAGWGGLIVLIALMIPRGGDDL